MGMYTGLRFKGFIKEEFREDIELVLNDSKEWGACKHQELLEFDEKFERSGFIPFGSSSYMTASWEGKPYDDKKPWECPATDGFDFKFNKETGYWSFQCSLKNYDGEIDYFVKTIIPLICSKLIHCEEYYEEWTTSILYELKDGEIKELDFGIRYEDEDYIPYYMQGEVTDDFNISYKDFDFEKEEREGIV